MSSKAGSLCAMDGYCLLMAGVLSGEVVCECDR